ncbi:hypothetical protein C2845_PM13G04600 [Panicum miliaceum]|uniref:Uncharacterized protein n=1 Tax=Panicum miliaceum TaxID=4540 RepID=A0A3L6RGX4_PANMI|nr:hypothetical protein C2845_PM13G04600 [Panicum miliaceum]
MEIEDDSDEDLIYEGYYRGGWVETDTEEEPMELPDDHPDAGGDDVRGDDAGNGGDDPDGQDGVDDELEDPLEPAAPATGPPDFQYKKEIHYFNVAEAARFQKGQQEAEWIVSVVISVPDERYGTRRKIQVHHDHVPKASLDAGASEASRRALASLCHTYREELQDSRFRLFPRRSKGAANAQILVPPPEERNPTMDAT